MEITLIDIIRVKKHLRVTHDHQDDLIKSQLDSAIQQVKDYLNKEVYEDKVALDAAVVAGKDATRVMLLKETVNSAIALLVEYNYYGVDSLAAGKKYDAALNLLNPDRFIVGW